MTPVLDASIGVTLGRLTIDAELQVGEGETIALLGPNGAGKTTCLRALAGLVRLDRGRIVAGGKVLDDPQAGTFVPAAGRGFGVVFQDHVLFPHMSVLDNVAFGLRARGLRRRDAAAEALRVLDGFGLEPLAGDRPATLSGGQAQRVALARAVAASPSVLLLDEPLAALDIEARAAVRAELKQRLAAVRGARVLVTHDALDAAVLADRVYVIERGRITQVGALAALAARPATPYVAELVGVNLLVGEVVGPHVVRLGSGSDIVTADPLTAGRAAVTIRPQAVALHLVAPEGSPRNVFPGRVVALEPVADRLRVRIEGVLPLVAEVTREASAELGLQPGLAVFASVKAVEVSAAPV